MFKQKPKQILSNEFQIYCFLKNFRIRLIKKNCCVRQNIVIERIIEYYWYKLYQIKELVKHLGS